MDRERLKAFGSRIRALRGRGGLTQAALAERSGLHLTQVSKLEAGEREPKLSTLLRLGKGLGVEPGELLGEATRGVGAVEAARMRALLQEALGLSYELRWGPERTLQKRLEALIVEAMEHLADYEALVREEGETGTDS